MLAAGEAPALNGATTSGGLISAAMLHQPGLMPLSVVFHRASPMAPLGPVVTVMPGAVQAWPQMLQLPRLKSVPELASMTSALSPFLAGSYFPSVLLRLRRES